MLAEISIINVEITDTTDSEQETRPSCNSYLPGTWSLSGREEEGDHVCPAGQENADTPSQSAPAAQHTRSQSPH